MSEVKEKRVNIYASRPTTIGFNIPRVGNQRNIVMSVEEIGACLCAHAKIEEIVSDGRVIPLDFSNYNKDNSIVTEITEQQPVMSIVDPKTGELISETEAASRKAMNQANATTTPVETKPEETKTEATTHQPPSCDPFADMAAETTTK